MGTLIMTAAQTTHMLVAIIQDDQISVAYPHTGRFDFIRGHRFASFCKEQGFPVRREVWSNVRVSRALMGAKPTHVAQNIENCFSRVYRMSGPFGLRLQGMGWHSFAKS